MMRYRRNRASTLEGAQQPQGTSSAPMAASGVVGQQAAPNTSAAPWAVYQGGAKPAPGQQVPQQSAVPSAQQQAALRKVKLSEIIVFMLRLKCSICI